MMKHNRTAPNLLSAFALASLLASSGCAVDDDVTVLRLAHGLSPDHPVHLGMAYMADRLAEKSDGHMRIDLYPSQQLGTERECLELLQIGSLDITKVSASLMEGFVRSFRVFSLPFLFEDSDHMFRVLQSDVGQRLLRDGESARIVGLTYYDAGSRSFYTTSRPVHSPDDLAGLKIRVQESATAMRMVRALGGSPTPISWGELYTALQQGVVDGAENNPPSFYLSRHYEVSRYYSLNEHTFVPDVLVISTQAWNRLSGEERRWLQEAAEESMEHQRELWRVASEEALAAVREAGVEIIYPDKEPFQERVLSMYDDFRTDPALAELIDAIAAID